MITFTVSDIGSIQELLTGAPLFGVNREKTGAVQLLFENAAYGALEELKIMPGGHMLATLLCDAEEEVHDDPETEPTSYRAFQPSAAELNEEVRGRTLTLVCGLNGTTDTREGIELNSGAFRPALQETASSRTDTYT